MNRIEAADNFIAGLGYEAYRVGGSVRDEIIGKRPKDADYMVRGVPLFELGQALVRAGADISALTARDMTQIGWRAAKKGIGAIEIVLPRTERNAGSGRRQVIKVDPDFSLAADAQRRDFTFNALYRQLVAGGTGNVSDALGDLHDPTGTGVYDLTHRILRTTHADSFRDDPLRMMRALRFVSTLNADLADDTEAQMREHAGAVDGLTAAGHTSGTLLDELRKLLMGQCPAKALRVARDTGVLAVAFPELAPMLGFEQESRYHDMTTDEHTFSALETAAHVDAPLRVRMALLFHDSGKPDSAWTGLDGRKHYYEPTDKDWNKLRKEAHGWDIPEQKPEDHEITGERRWRAAAARMNADRKLRDDVALLIRNHMVPCQKVNRVKVRRERVRLGDDLLRDLYMMRMCDLSGKGKKNMKFLENVRDMEIARIDAMAAGVPSSVKELAINGRDAHLYLGLEGREIGDALRAVLDEVVVRGDARSMDREWQVARLNAWGHNR